MKPNLSAAGAVALPFKRLKNVLSGYLRFYPSSSFSKEPTQWFAAFALRAAVHDQEGQVQIPIVDGGEQGIQTGAAELEMPLLPPQRVRFVVELHQVEQLSVIGTELGQESARERGMTARFNDLGTLRRLGLEGVVRVDEQAQPPAVRLRDRRGRKCVAFRSRSAMCARRVPSGWPWRGSPQSRWRW